MSRTNWKNLPDKSTPIISENLKADYDDLKGMIDKFVLLADAIGFYVGMNESTNTFYIRCRVPNTDVYQLRLTPTGISYQKYDHTTEQWTNIWSK